MIRCAGTAYGAVKVFIVTGIASFIVVMNTNVAAVTGKIGTVTVVSFGIRFKCKSFCLFAADAANAVSCTFFPVMRGIFFENDIITDVRKRASAIIAFICGKYSTCMGGECASKQQKGNQQANEFLYGCLSPFTKAYRATLRLGLMNYYRKRITSLKQKTGIKCQKLT